MSESRIEIAPGIFVCNEEAGAFSLDEEVRAIVNGQLYRRSLRGKLHRYIARPTNFQNCFTRALRTVIWRVVFPELWRTIHTSSTDPAEPPSSRSSRNSTDAGENRANSTRMDAAVLENPDSVRIDSDLNVTRESETRSSTKARISDAAPGQKTDTSSGVLSTWYVRRLSINSSKDDCMLALLMDMHGPEYGWFTYQLVKGSPLRMDRDYAAARKKKAGKST